MKTFVLLGTLVFAATASAQMVPAIERGDVAMVEPEMMAPTSTIRITDKERAALAIASKWKNSPEKPRTAEDGTVVYLFSATIPTMICAPLQACGIRLQPGEVIYNVNVGDKVRWTTEPAAQGEGPSMTEIVIVKPLYSGLTTNLLITTNRRSYTILLKSAKHEWIPMIAFDYPDDQDKVWAKYKAGRARVMNSTTLATGESTLDMDFNYKISGDSPKWKPVRVYNNGTKTIIEFDQKGIANEAPALVAIGKSTKLWSGATEQIVNYRPKGDHKYEVDLVLDKAALISGVGNAQRRVDIEYIGGKK